MDRVDAAARQALAGADPAGVRGRSAAAGARTRPRRSGPPPPTTPPWWSAWGCASTWSPARRQTARSRRATIWTGRSGCCRAAQSLVEAAGPEALQIDGHVEEPERLHLAQRAERTSGSTRRCDLRRRHLDARDRVVKADAALAKAEAVQRPLRSRHLAQRVQRDSRAVGEARRQARARRLVPRRQAELAAERADLRLRQLRLRQRVVDAASPRPPASPADSRPDRRDSRRRRCARCPACRPPSADVVQVALAQVAAIRRVAGVAGNVELVGVDDQVAYADRLGQRQRQLVVFLRRGRRARGEGDDSFARAPRRRRAGERWSRPRRRTPPGRAPSRAACSAAARACPPPQMPSAWKTSVVR